MKDFDTWFAEQGQEPEKPELEDYVEGGFVTPSIEGPSIGVEYVNQYSYRRIGNKVLVNLGTFRRAKEAPIKITRIPCVGEPRELQWDEYEEHDGYWIEEGKVFAKCCVCGREDRVDADPKEMKEGYEHYCGHGPRCCP